MIHFTDDELTLISLYDPGSRNGVIREIRSMMTCLQPDETELKGLAEETLRKLGRVTDEAYDGITRNLILRMPVGWDEFAAPENDPDN